MKKAVDVILRMKKSGAKIYFTYTSNMVTSGLRGFFAQLIELKIIDVIVTTVGGIEEDIMKAKGEEFIIGNFKPDDNGKVPLLKSNFESKNIPNLFFAGILSQEISYKKSSGPFIHGFRYLTKSMIKIDTNSKS